MDANHPQRRIIAVGVAPLERAQKSISATMQSERLRKARGLVGSTDALE
jgi:hypothetical protein